VDRAGRPTTDSSSRPTWAHRCFVGATLAAALTLTAAPALARPHGGGDVGGDAGGGDAGGGGAHQAGPGDRGRALGAVGEAAPIPEAIVVRPSAPLPLDEVESTAAPAPAAVPAEERPEVVIRTLLGLVALLGLAYLGGHPRVQQWERRIGISQVITSGFPFVVLGLVASLPAIDVLNDQVVSQLGPLLRLGLGWIGFMVGFRFDARRLQELPSGIAAVAAPRVAIAFLAIASAAAAVYLVFDGFSASSLSEPTFVRDALILGAAGIVSSRASPAILGAMGVPRGSSEAVSLVVRIEELAAIFGLCVVAAYFRPGGGDASWQLPGTAWLLLTLGLGLTLGIVIYAVMLLRTSATAESMALTLGSISFGAGMSSNLRLSPVVVCFVAGVLVANFPGPYKDRLRQTLARLERPIYFAFLMVVGALWNAGDAVGWILMVTFVAARLLGRWLATRVATTTDIELDPRAERALVFGPMGGLPVAIVVNAGILYPGRSVSWIVTAVLGAAIVSEVLVQRVGRVDPGATPLPQPPPDAPPPDDALAAEADEQRP
jgi:hypothetical protein